MSDDINKPFDPYAVAEAGRATAAGTTTTTLEGFEVELPSGARLTVPNEEEESYLRRLVDGYRQDYDLRNVADLSELDRCIGLELQMHRMQVWILRRRDYDNKAVDENALSQRSKEISGEIRQVKKTLGIDRVARDRQSGKGSVAEFINNLLLHAKEFGVMRNMQQARAIELAMQLISLIQARNNCTTDAEKRKLAVTDEDIFDWIETVFMPEFLVIDADFREGKQKMWILEQ